MNLIGTFLRSVQMPGPSDLDLLAVVEVDTGFWATDDYSFRVDVEADVVVSYLTHPTTQAIFGKKAATLLLPVRIQVAVPGMYRIVASLDGERLVELPMDVSFA